MKIGWAKGLVLAMTTMLGTQGANAAVTVTKTAFGNLPDGQPAELYTLHDPELEVKITNYGARVTSILAKDRDGRPGDVVLGYNSVAGYTAEGAKRTYFGAIVGRYGNRIRNGKFSLDGHAYQIPPNDNGNALHGGPAGFADKLWTARQLPDGVEMTLVSPDGDMGFPGQLTVHVRYVLVGSSLEIHYSATTDRPTVLNLTNHTYFNLSGEGSGTILNEVFTLNADGYTPVDKGLIPVGGVKPVAGTPFDFRKPTPIGQRIDQQNEQLTLAGGYDHNWVLNGPDGVMKLAARVVDPATGRTLTVRTTQPGVQFYAGNFLDGSYSGKAGKKYNRRDGFCLETQHFPDSPNQPHFPSTELKPGQTMHSETIFQFGAEK